MDQNQRAQYAEAMYLLKSSAQRPYYEARVDDENKLAYYNGFDIGGSGVLKNLAKLVSDTHRQTLSYAPYRHLYPWVDLHENMTLKSIYSGTGIDPVSAIEADIAALKQFGEAGVLAGDVKLNCEHVVPQSWFGKKEPMRGDLHHLFACEPSCNSRRGNSRYYDFPGYPPLAMEVREGCGKAENNFFEPQYGKGQAARATLYFFIRYGSDFLERADMDLMIEWHLSNPVTLYEKHRNAAIHEIQGNRNPFIDFPDLAGNMNIENNKKAVQ
ncbi:endonuclease I family protein [Peribacillus sp. SCS-37]|uniref:endonuclease I family protein n=1 Tax=Paraperibacillus esterisolvens TaxID=3115296 RepID=UPI003906BDFD